VWEKARYGLLQEVKDYDDAIAKWSEAPPARAEGIDQAERGYRHEALKLYQTILKSYPAIAQGRGAFVVAYNLYEAGSKQEAIQSYNTLIKQIRSPGSCPTPTCRWRAFLPGKNDLDRAAAAFERPLLPAAQAHPSPSTSWPGAITTPATRVDRSLQGSGLLRPKAGDQPRQDPAAQ